MAAPTIAREAAAEPTRTTQVLRVSAGTAAAGPDTLAVEEPLEIHLNGWRWLVTMRTPGADADLVLGMLASEGVIASATEVTSIVFRRHPEEPELANVVDVQLDQPLAELTSRLARNQTLASTSCGLCGASSVAAILQHRPPVAPGPVIGAHVLAELPFRLAAAQAAFQSTGGLHAAGVFDTEGVLLAAREDVGRHNAVDKVIGWRMRNHPQTATPILMVSGRASFEIVQKALAAAIPIVAAVSAPSSLAVALAEEAGMTLAGFVRDGSYNLYSGPARVRTTDAGRDPAVAEADPLAFIPQNVRTALDEIARKISLADWRALTRPERTHLITLCEHASRDDFAVYLAERVRVRTGRAPRVLPPADPRP
jgi:FdhD protein